MNGDDQSETAVEMYKSTLSVPSLDIVYFARMRNGFEDAIRTREDFRGSFSNSRGSQSEQISVLEDALSSDLDFVMAVPIRKEAVAPIVKAASDRDIPFVAVDRNVTGADPATYVASDNVRLGRRSVSQLHDSMRQLWEKDPYNIVELQGTQGASVTEERHEGGMAALDGRDIDVIGSEPGQFAVDEAADVTADLIDRHGDDIDGIYAHNDLMALGAHRALADSDLEDVPISGIDGSREWVELFEDNEQYGTIAQLPERMIQTAIDLGIRAAQGEQLEEYCRIEGLEVTAANAADYLAEYF